jgi:hypothetical protein
MSGRTKDRLSLLTRKIEMNAVIVVITYVNISSHSDLSVPRVLIASLALIDYR